MSSVLIAGLCSEFTAVLKDSSSSSGSTSENIPHGTNNLEPQLNMLHTDLSNISATVYQHVKYLNQNASNGIDYIGQHMSITRESLRELQDSIALLTSSVSVLEGNFSEQLNDVSNTTTAMLKRLNNEILQTIMSFLDNSVTTINTMHKKLANGTQILNNFDFRGAVFNFSTQLPSGQYNIKAGNSSRE